MIRPALRSLVVLAALLPAAAAAQTLTLADAVARATADNVEARIAALREREAAARVPQAAAGFLPRLDVTQDWQRGNQPVFVFGTLLAQRRFTASDFALEALNQPEAVANIRTAVTLEQRLFDGGAARARLRSARLGRDLEGAERARTTRELALAATRAYGAVLAADAAIHAADAGLEAAGADLAAASARRDAGLVTDADVLAIEVQRARMQEARIRAAAGARIARARLNDAMHAPLDAPVVLAPVAAPPAGGPLDAAALETGTLEREAIERRPEVRAARLAAARAGVDVSASRAAFLPTAAVQGGWEWNGAAWPPRAGSWTIGVSARINVFAGLADRGRFQEAQAADARARLGVEAATAAVRLDVQVAIAELDAARAREQVAAAVGRQAGEHHRIVRDRYQQGLAELTALAAAADGIAAAELQATTARVDVFVAAAALDRAVGR